MHIYDYLFAAIVIIAMLLGSTVMITALSSPVRNASERDLLKMAAEKIMIQMLLDPGHPYYWGSNGTLPENLKVFGLAKYGLTSRQAYELDPNKVLRIDSALWEASDPNFVSATTAAQLLCLNNTADSLDYGFTLEFEETIRVNSSSMGGNKYSVSVLSDYGLPIIGANVSATLYYVDGDSICSAVNCGQTSYDGKCTLDYGEAGIDSPSKVLAVAVDYCGAKAIKLFDASENATPACLFDDYVIPYPNSPLNVPDGYGYGREIVLFQNSTGIETRDFQVRYFANSINLTLDSVPESSAVAVLAVSPGPKLVYAQRDFSSISYRTIPKIQSAASAYSLERTVLISGTTFTATLYFWRMTS